MQQRQCIVLQGAPDWAWQQVDHFHDALTPERAILLSDTQPSQKVSKQKQALKQIGQEFDFIVFDAADSLNADCLGAILGTLKAGGLFILLLADAVPKTPWRQRFHRIVQHYCQQYAEFHFIRQASQPGLPKLTHAESTSVPSFQLTDDQQQALQAIHHVVSGHRRRPLVLHADRGRGKSAVLGVAAAELITQGKQKIIVTAPSLATVETLFKHAGEALPDAEAKRGSLRTAQGQIQFIAPDALLQSMPKADLLIVDEAAAIPASMLTQILRAYSRIVFASTLHGYEGTGRGFAIRFQQTLNQQAPGWHALQMNTPVRWRKDDRLEQFSFEALLLNASPVEDEDVADAMVDDCQFEVINTSELAANETDLRALFGLMVLAHYRTRPSDLQMMLDNDAVTVAVLRFQGRIIACAWLIQEGPLEPLLAEAVFAGERRLQGHLLPQSLLAHAGIATAGGFNYQRIGRIAVHPALQRRGLGHLLVDKLFVQLQSSETDVMGTSFAADAALLPFWHHAGMRPVRVGLHHDEVSGQHALMMLKPVSNAGAELITQAEEVLRSQWSLCLGQVLPELDADVAVLVSQYLTAPDADLSVTSQAEVNAFAYRQRSYEASQIALWHWCRLVIHQAEFMQLERKQQHLLLRKLLQQHDWASLAQQLGYQGKAEMVMAMREAVRQLLCS